MIATADGVDRSVSTVYKRNPLSVVCAVYDELRQLVNVCRSEVEKLPEFELRFAAQLRKFNSIGATGQLQEAIRALVLLGDANLWSVQRIFILAAAQTQKCDLHGKSFIENFISTVNYETLASASRQCQ